MDSAKHRLLEKNLGYRFQKPQHLVQALTHPAYAHNRIQMGRRQQNIHHQGSLTTLGDAILKTGLILLLMKKRRTTRGSITISKERLEKNLKLAEIGKRLELLSFDSLTGGIKNQQQLDMAEKKILSDTVEALMAAIFIDSGYSMAATTRCIRKLFKSELEKLDVA